MVFQTFKLYITNWAAIGSNETYITIPIEFKALYNKIYLKYLSIDAAVNDGGANRYGYIDCVIEGVKEHTNNLEMGAVVLTNMNAGTVAKENIDGICFNKSSYGLIPQIELSASFNIKLYPTFNTSSALGDDYYIYVTIGYDV